MHENELQRHMNRKRLELMNAHRKHENLERRLVEINKQKIRDEKALENKYNRMVKPLETEQAVQARRRKNAAENLVTYGLNLKLTPEETFAMLAIRTDIAGRRLASFFRKHRHTILAAKYLPGGPGFNNARRRFYEEADPKKIRRQW
jgi:hypothetical protein